MTDSVNKCRYQVAPHLRRSLQQGNTHAKFGWSCIRRIVSAVVIYLILAAHQTREVQHTYIAMPKQRTVSCKPMSSIIWHTSVETQATLDRGLSDLALEMALLKPVPSCHSTLSQNHATKAAFWLFFFSRAWQRSRADHCR